MEEHLSPITVTHLLQHTLRSLCNHENSQWVYAVFWRILPRNYPPPKWESQGAYDRSRGNRRNWILVWEDGFCNFAASSTPEINSGDCPTSSSVYGNCESQPYQGLQPELFFKMSHEIYNYGEGLIGKVAADHSHKWIYKEPNDQEINFLSSWHNSAESYPRTWEAQFQSGIKTIALIAVREGVIQLGAIHKVIEDLSYVVLLRKKLSYIESIPGVLLPHPSSSTYPYKVEGYGAPEQWHFQGSVTPSAELYDHFNQPLKITPSMSSLEALLSKLPSVVPPPPPTQSQTHPSWLTQRHLEFMDLQNVMAKQELDEELYRPELHMGESSSSMPGYHHQHQD
ncbi:protein RICE SALT SENSITIVE 3-like [Gastrolobium bilobum]|uniref:protein RICE SALT SENSITIVE 3-like n=1 Tax=Gastrolobium bilobum TaxID=150636 RepID=UPI002AAF15E1|nr:protein RICE SALT SENSITIVE 3-like [Gastrolobium bilobum]